MSDYVGAQQLSRYRLIGSYPYGDPTFRDALAEKIADVNDAVARELWELVRERCEDLPPTEPEAQRY